LDFFQKKKTICAVTELVVPIDGWRVFFWTKKIIYFLMVLTQIKCRISGLMGQSNSKFRFVSEKFLDL